MSADVQAAMLVLEEAASERETAQERIHARAALALVAQALAEREGRIGALEAHHDKCVAEMTAAYEQSTDQLLDRAEQAESREGKMRAYACHLPECALFAGVNSEGCYNPGPCSCGLAALLPPGAPDGR